MLRFAAVGKACLVSLLSDTTRTVTSFEKFRHQTPSPISLWVCIRQSLGKRRQRAHRRRFTRPPRSSIRAGL